MSLINVAQHPCSVTEPTQSSEAPKTTCEIPHFPLLSSTRTTNIDTK